MLRRVESGNNMDNFNCNTHDIAHDNAHCSAHD